MISCWMVVRNGFHSDVFRSQTCYFHLCFFSLLVQLQCSEFEWWYLWCSFAVFVSLLPRDWPQRLTGRLTCWIVHGIVDDLMLGLLNLCSICQGFSIRLYIVIFSSIKIGWQLHQSIGWLIDQSVDVWLIGWSTDRSIDSFIDWLVAGWEAIVVHAFGLTSWFTFPVPCANERCDPWEFALVLRGFVELISVMVRFRNRCYFAPPGDDRRTPHLEPSAKRIENPRSRNRLTMRYMIAFGPNAGPSGPWQCILSEERSALCKLSARSGLQGLKSSSAEFLKPKSM